MVDWKVFLKGLAMGFSDVIPGVSGGTIALITGVYEQFISSVGAIPFVARNFFQKKWKRLFKPLNLPFLIPLVLGILIAMLATSGLMLYLLDNLYGYTISFFIGIILFSSVWLGKEHKAYSLWSFLGLLVGLSFAFIIPHVPNPTYGYTFLSGILAIMAMFLPGISGSFILLLLGMYEFILAKLHAPDLHLVVFVLGVILGAVIISRFIAYLLKKFHRPVMHILIGLVLGSLSVPIRNLLGVEFSFLFLAPFLLGGVLAYFLSRV